jgi:catechol 2,3-dioxygenase-like lactoylglutathione lyase family enzyme
MSASLKSVGAITLFVDDQRGVDLLNGPMNREWGVRTAAFTDPDGHIWEIAQELP